LAGVGQTVRLSSMSSRAVIYTPGAGEPMGMSSMRLTVVGMADLDGRSGPAATGRVPTWRDGVLLNRREKAELSPEQLQQYLDDSVVRDLAEIELMPEPTRSWARSVLEQARAHVQARVAEQERGQAS
jgi:hypothetical protein